MKEKVDSLKLLACFQSISSLSIVKNQLELEGITCYTENENFKYSIGNVAEGIELYVLIEDYEKAKKIFNQGEI